MNKREIRQMLINQLATLEMNKSAAFQTGNFEEFAKLEIDINETQTKIDNIQCTNHSHMGSAIQNACSLCPRLLNCLSNSEETSSSECIYMSTMFNEGDSV